MSRVGHEIAVTGTCCDVIHHVIMTSSISSDAVKLQPVRFWAWCCWLLLLWIILSPRSSDVEAANSISVLDSKLQSLYQNYQQPYDDYELGFAADPVGYESRNGFQSHHPGGKTAEDTFKAGPGKYPVDDGYNTKTIPLYQHHEYPHDAGGYATMNAFQPHYPAVNNKYHGDGGYHTRTIGFPLYQDYHHPPHNAEPDGYATRNAFHPYRSGGQHTKDAPTTTGPGKHLTDGGGYHTITAESKWLPLYQDHQHPHDPGGYATQNAFQPYRSAVDEVAGFHAGYKTRTADSQYVDETVDEDRGVYRQFSSDVDEAEDDRHHYVNKYRNDDDGVTDDWLSQRRTPPPAAAAAAAADYSHSRCVHEP